jgi:hypothetical protein
MAQDDPGRDEPRDVAGEARDGGDVVDRTSGSDAEGAGDRDAGAAEGTSGTSGGTGEAVGWAEEGAGGRSGGHDPRLRLTPWVIAAAAVAVALLVAAVVDERWVWVGTVLLAVATGAAAEAAASGKSTVLRELVLGEQDPISVTTSLDAEHLLRIGSSADPYYQEVIPVTGAHRVQLVVTSRSERPVVVRALRPLVVARRPTRRGEAGVTSGILPEGHFDVLLDADPPALQPAVSAAGQVLAELPLTLSPDEPLTIVFTPRTDAYEVDWRIEIDWVCAGKEGSVAVGLAGKPFRTTAETGW